MLFNRKLSRCISVVLASSAFCSNSLVGAITCANTLIRAELKFLDKIVIPDDAKNVKLLKFIANDLQINGGNKKVLDYKSGELEVNVETWFRDTMCQCFASLDKEHLKEMAICVYRYTEYNIHELLTSSVKSNIQSELRSLRKLKDNDEIEKYKTELCSVCFGDFLNQICMCFDTIKSSERGNCDVEYWKVITNFFKSLLLDVSMKSLACNSDYGSVNISKICLSHIFILVVDLFKCFGIEKKEKIDLDSVYSKNINSIEECRNQIGSFFYDCQEKINKKGITIPFDRLFDCASTFFSFIYAMMVSYKIHDLLK